MLSLIHSHPLFETEFCSTRIKVENALKIKEELGCFESNMNVFRYLVFITPFHTIITVAKGYIESLNG